MNPQVMTRINKVLVKIANSDNVSMDSALFEDQVFFDNSDTFDESALGDSEKLYPGSELTVIKCLAILFSWF